MMQFTFPVFMSESSLWNDGLSYVARTYKDAPDIDGYLFVTGVKRELMTGDYVKVLITGSNEYDLIGEIEDELT